ncbi:MAG: hypothetical protein PHO01_06985 [Desulfotomaculaceae bacterium]|nr:hypothetical protein [Desulfotomaculaceae bacterium]
MKSKYIICGIITFLLVVVFLLIYFYSGAEWLKEFSMNVATEVLGIIITVFVIDYLIDKKEEDERYKRQAVAIKRMRVPLIHHIHTLFNIFKASIEKEPDKKYNTLSDLFDDFYFEQIQYLDFSMEAPILPKTNWVNYLYNEFTRFADELKKVLDTYSLFLDSEIIELLDCISNSNFLNYVCKIRNIHQIDAQLDFKRKYLMLNGTADLCKEHIEILMKLIDFCNKSLSEADRIQYNEYLWRAETASETSSR